MTKKLEEIRDGLAWTMAMEFCKDFGVSPDSNHYKYASRHAKRLFDAAVAALAEIGMSEFDEEAFDAVYQPEYENDEIHEAIERGARWQHEQTAAQIVALKAEIAKPRAYGALKCGECGNQLLTTFGARMKDEIATLKAENDKILQEYRAQNKLITSGVVLTYAEFDEKNKEIAALKAENEELKDLVNDNCPECIYCSKIAGSSVRHFGDCCLITELKKQLAEKESVIAAFEVANNNANTKIAELEKEVSHWKLRAEKYLKERNL